MTVICFFIAFVSFLLGFHLGFKRDKKPQNVSKPKVNVVEDDDFLKNFLSYDGTEQL